MKLLSNKNNIILFIILFILFFSSCSSQDNSCSDSEFMFDTIVTVTLYDNAGGDVFNDIFAFMKNMENTLSKTIESSDISNINQMAGISPANVSRSTLDIIKKSIYYSEVSSGYFDISIAPLVELWGIGTGRADIPSEDAVKLAVEKINYKNIEINDEKSTVFLKEKGMSLDLGAIAKGYIADKTVMYIKEKGYDKAIINLGGNIYALGKKDKKNMWKIGIQNPFEETGRYIGIVNVENKSIVTSGIYERFFEKDGIRYHHILNPFTGYPFDNDIASVTIISDFSTDGDALSTAAFALGIENGLKLVESLDGVEALFVKKDKALVFSSGFINNTQFKITNESFYAEKGLLKKALE